MQNATYTRLAPPPPLPPSLHRHSVLVINEGKSACTSIPSLYILTLTKQVPCHPLFLQQKKTSLLESLLPSCLSGQECETSAGKLGAMASSCPDRQPHSCVGEIWSGYQVHRKKRFTSFPSPAGMSLTKLPLGRNNSVMLSLFPPRESLVVTSRLGTGNSGTFFLRCIYLHMKHEAYIRGGKPFRSFFYVLLPYIIYVMQSGRFS